jgi:hypothetical protein
VFAVDANILVYAMDTAATLRSPCRRAAEHWRAQTWSFVESLLCSPGLRMLAATDRHGEAAGSIMHDAETAILMRERGVRRRCRPLSASRGIVPTRRL